MEAVISMKLKSDPKYALKPFLALKMHECCNVVEDDDDTAAGELDRILLRLPLLDFRKGLRF